MHMKSKSFVMAAASLIIVSATATGCRVGSTGLDVIVTEASFAEFEEIGLVIIGGATWGEGVINFVDEADVVRSVPVEFGGPSVGMLMDVHVAREDLLFENSATVELQIPEGGVPADDLFGVYDGGGGGLALGLGYCQHELDNQAAVRFVLSGICGGMNMAAHESWVTFDVAGDVTEGAAPTE